MTKDDSQPTTQRIYQQIREVLIQARSRALQVVNTEMVACYWQIGRLIVEEEQRGEKRAEYGKRLIRDLSKRLSEEFGKGFDRTNLQHMRVFYLGFSNCDALRRELSWTHYRLLLRVEKPEARAFYEAEAVNSRWSTRELERQINSLLFERLALSRDKAGVLALANKGHEIQQPADLVKDPYVLEFTGIKQDERFLEKDLYTLPEDNKQIFASRYKLYLPTEEELAAEIIKERKTIEMEQRLSREDTET
jgi:predicted GNAT family N-acyltransferase